MFSITKQDLRFLILMALAVSLMFSIVACGGGSEPEVAPTTTVPEATEPPPTPTQAQENADDLVKAAADYYDAGEYDKAIAELEKVIALEPGNADAHTNLALSYFKDGDYEQAAAAWTEVIALTPEEAEPYYERGMSYFNLKQYAKAIDDFTQVIALDPEHADAYRVRGKSHAFMENYEQAIADFTQTLELDPTSDEAYFNRAVARTQIGNMDDLPSIIMDYGKVMQISEDADMREQATKTLETFLENSEDPELRQLAADALEGKVAAADEPEADTEPSLMDIDINRDPGHSIALEGSLAAGESHRFLFLASPGDTVSAGVSSSSELLIGIQNASTGQVLGVAPSDGEPLVVNFPANALYHIVVEDAGGEGGDYVATFEASPRVSFALDPNYFMIGRLPEGGLLYYTYTGPAGSTLQGNVIPHPDTPVDLVVTIRDLESQTVLYEANDAGAGENEQFTFTVPDDGSGQLLTYIVSVEDVDRNKGAYILAVTGDVPVGVTAPMSPKDIVQIVFDAAVSGDFAPLKNLCDPLGENDGDTQMICDLGTDETDWENFVAYFASGEITGEPILSEDGMQAAVPVLLGPEGDQQEETIILVNRSGQWYLFSF